MVQITMRVPWDQQASFKAHLVALGTEVKPKVQELQE
jgi:hypothetical protein